METKEKLRQNLAAIILRWVKTVSWLILRLKELGSIFQAWNCSVLNGCAIFKVASPVPFIALKSYIKVALRNKPGPLLTITSILQTKPVTPYLFVKIF